MSKRAFFIAVMAVVCVLACLVVVGLWLESDSGSRALEGAGAKTESGSVGESAAEQNVESVKDGVQVDDDRAEKVVAAADEGGPGETDVRRVNLTAVPEEEESVGREDLSVGIEQAKMQIYSLIKGGNFPAAEVAVKRLVYDFNSAPGLPDALNFIANEYRWADRYDDANEIYVQIAEQNPESVAAVLAELGLVRMYILSQIRAREDDDALDRIYEMVENFQGHPDLAETLYWFGKQYEWKQSYKHSQEVYRLLLEQCGESEYAEKAEWDATRVLRRSGVFGLIESGADAWEAIDEFVSDFNGHAELASELYWVARKYDEEQRYSDANRMFARIVELFPEDESRLLAEMDMEKLRIGGLCDIGEYDEAREALDAFMGEYSGASYLAEAVFMVAERLYFRGSKLCDEDSQREKAEACFDDSIEIFNIVRGEFPESNSAIRALCWSGDCRYKLGDYDGALEWYQQVLDRHSENVAAGYALFKRGQIYQKLKKAGKVSEEQADRETRQAYERLVKDYPEEVRSESAKNWLARNSRPDGNI